MTGILERMEEKLPEQFKGKRNLGVILSAVADEMEELERAFRQLVILRTIDEAQGVNLDGIGSIVVLDREEAREMLAHAGDRLTDELYRVFLRYKALKNVHTCNYEQMAGLLRIVYKAFTIKYREHVSHPAHFSLMVGTDIALDVIELMAHSKMTIKPGGVSVELSFRSGDCFGFKDISPDAKGFGEGAFALAIM